MWWRSRESPLSVACLPGFSPHGSGLHSRWPSAAPAVSPERDGFSASYPRSARTSARFTDGWESCRKLPRDSRLPHYYRSRQRIDFPNERDKRKPLRSSTHLQIDGTFGFLRTANRRGQRKNRLPGASPQKMGTDLAVPNPNPHCGGRRTLWSEWPADGRSEERRGGEE